MAKIHNEQEFLSSLIKWMRHNYRMTFCWEGKFVRNGKYYYKSDKSLQKEITNLKICGKHYVKKNSDLSQMGTDFDGISVCESPGFIFVMFDEEPWKEFYIIEVSALDKEIKSGAKSLTKQRAHAICERIGALV